MANSFTQYAKDLWNSLFNSSENSEKYDTDRKELEDFLTAVDEKVVIEAPKLPDTPEYEKIEYKGLSDEEIANKAQDELNAYYQQNINAIEDETEAQRAKYESDKENVKAAASTQNEQIGEVYEKAKENTSNDSLKRGLARSSIAVNKIAGLENDKATAINKVNAELTNKINELDAEISGLTVKREKALNDFNIAYASKLTNEINSLKDEREQKQLEALKYNNTLAEKEYSDKIEKAKTESDLYSEKLAQKEKTDKLNIPNEDERQKAIYQKMRTILASQPAAEANKLLKSDPIYRDYLNDYYYYRLYDEFGRT